MKCELYHDNFQNFKRYNVPKAQLVIADIPYNIGADAYVRGYSWTKISARLGTADSTARDWHTRAMERLGEVLEELPEAEALARRASRART